MSRTMEFVKPWDWRKSIGGWTSPEDAEAGERLFHAYDVNDNAACNVGYGLMASVEEPNEGSRFCPSCVEAVKAVPQGRDKRIYDENGRLVGGEAG